MALLCHPDPPEVNCPASAWKVGGGSMMVSRSQGAWVWPLRCSVWVSGLGSKRLCLSMEPWDAWLGVHVPGLGSIGLYPSKGVLLDIVMGPVCMLWSSVFRVQGTAWGQVPSSWGSCWGHRCLVFPLLPTYSSWVAIGWRLEAGAVLAQWGGLLGAWSEYLSAS